ncbi:NAD(P)-dependent dehydrogenase, short-chain alcohol dehydrogenase family [Stigmatella erecta]|uniref:NAD(P)-dependent dehydrogenase, short-chain alcohol dehydrogenase family n=2 Tax=Stigmatella erecta TaxID=83460 RepID=A0A1I0LEY5_9BACT|nr:NAD(P)-dependent dehydrogenase, short-chain alcohol dehydrogenase family [Stigmatella erecta]
MLPMRYAISGASRGIGLEFVRQLLERGDTVEAGVRAPAEARLLAPLVYTVGPRLRIHELDITNQASVKAFAAAVNDGPLDVLINNAGISGKWCSFMEMDYEDMTKVMETNSVGPMRLSAALMPAVLKGPTRKIIHLTTRMASLTENTRGGVYGFEGGAYAYRMSKAALNVCMRTMAVDFRDQGLITAAINPGWVRTEMGGKLAPMRPEDAVRGMLRVIDDITKEQSGMFLDFQGREVPW